MFCSNCGKELDNNAVVCTGCGCATSNYAVKGTAPDDEKSFGFAVLGFFFPLIGLILYLVWNNERPLRAKSCGKGALIGVISYVAFIILYVIFVVALAFAVASETMHLTGLL